ncbi:MAG: class I SAM-dependent methyltransferase [Propylenella sp.]
MTEVWQLYDEAAVSYDRDRRELRGEELYLREATSRLKKRRPQVLDLGCGTGAPIARYLIENSCEVTGVDAAPAMIALAQDRFPDMTWLVDDMRTLSLGRRFDAIIAWDSFFHLGPDDQRAMFPVFRDHAGGGASLLFTSGPDAGEAIGSLYGRDLYNASLSAGEYRELLHRHRFEVLRHSVKDAECGGHTVWLAGKR